MDEFLKNLYELIAMQHEYFKQELSAEHGIICGEYRENADYSCVRHLGSSDWLLIYTVSGAGLVSAGHHQHTCQAGEFVLWHPGVIQEYATSGDQWHLLWVHFIPPQEWTPYLRWRHIETGLDHTVIDPRHCSKVETAFRRIHQNYASPFRQRYELAKSALYELLLWVDAYRDQEHEEPVDHRILQAQEFICENYSSPLSLVEVARQVNLSVPRLVALFKQETGTTVKDYLEGQRILRAQNLLRYTGSSVTEVSERCGYNHPFYFSRRFKQYTGMSPRDFRNEVRGAEDA